MLGGYKRAMLDMIIGYNFGMMPLAFNGIDGEGTECLKL